MFSAADVGPKASEFHGGVKCAKGNQPKNLCHPISLPQNCPPPPPTHTAPPPPPRSSHKYPRLTRPGLSVGCNRKVVGSIPGLGMSGGGRWQPCVKGILSGEIAKLSRPWRPQAPPALNAPTHTQHTGQHGDDGLGGTTPLPGWSWGSEPGSGLKCISHWSRGNTGMHPWPAPWACYNGGRPDLRMGHRRNSSAHSLEAMRQCIEGVAPEEPQCPLLPCGSALK